MMTTVCWTDLIFALEIPVESSSTVTVDLCLENPIEPVDDSLDLRLNIPFLNIDVICTCSSALSWYFFNRKLTFSLANLKTFHFLDRASFPMYYRAILYKCHLLANHCCSQHFPKVENGNIFIVSPPAAEYAPTCSRFQQPYFPVLA